MSREYPARPIVGVGVVVWHGERVLLVQRGKPPAWAIGACRRSAAARRDGGAGGAS